MTTEREPWRGPSASFLFALAALGFAMVGEIGAAAVLVMVSILAADE